MARVAEEPTPSPGRVFARSLRHLALRDALATLVTAWRLAFEPSGQVRARSRASAAALFLSVIVLVGVGGSLLTSTALVLLGPDGPTPQRLSPGASPTDAIVIGPSPSVSPPVATVQPEAIDASPSRPPADETTEPREADPQSSRERVTPEPKERERDEKEKRETPEPGEREGDDQDERDDDEDDD